MTPPVDWLAADFGGRVHVAGDGSFVGDRHTASEDAAEGTAG